MIVICIGVPPLMHTAGSPGRASKHGIMRLRKVTNTICSGAREREEAALHCSFFALIPVLD
jgi:hypothetical protein